MPTLVIKMHRLARKIWARIWIIRHVPYWIFLLLFIASALVSISSLRHNNQEMIRLRGAVFVADKNKGDVNTALNNLRHYVYGHMNTSLSSGGNAIKPPIQLKYTYQRLQTAEKSKVAAANSNVYTQAQIYCQRLNPVDFSGRNRVPCVRDYVTTHGVKAAAIPVALYQYDFISPTWSPDLAGWSLLASLLLFIIAVGSFMVDRLVNAKLKPL